MFAAGRGTRRTGPSLAVPVRDTADSHVVQTALAGAADLICTLRGNRLTTTGQIAKANMLPFVGSRRAPRLLKTRDIFVARNKGIDDSRKGAWVVEDAAPIS